MFLKPLERWGRTLGETLVLITDRCLGGLSRVPIMNGVRKVSTLIICFLNYTDQFHPVKYCQSPIWGSDVCGLIRWGDSCQSGAIQSDLSTFKCFNEGKWSVQVPRSGRSYHFVGAVVAKNAKSPETNFRIPKCEVKIAQKKGDNLWGVKYAQVLESRDEVSQYLSLSD